MVDEGYDERAATAARTQSLFRDVNERVKEINEAFSLAVPLGEWACECANQLCAERIALTMGEYERIRAHPKEFAVAPGDEHVYPEVERVIDRNERFWTVEKYGDAGRLAELVDPRSDHAARRRRVRASA